MKSVITTFTIQQNWRWVILSNESSSKLEKWRAKYAALVIALGCLYSVIIGWGENWILTSILGLGVIVCGIIGFCDIKRFITSKAKNGDF